MTSQQSGQQPNLAQDEHDKWLENQSNKDLKRLARSLKDLYLSKVGNVRSSSGGAMNEPNLKRNV